MKSNPFKAFQVFHTNGGYSTLKKYSATPGALAKAEQRLADRLSADPYGGQWGTLGLVEPDGVSLLLPVSRGVLLAVQFNDRILPSATRDEKVREKVAELMEQTGRAVSKKEYAQLRDEVELELLPKSHIRRSVVPVLVTEQHALIFTSSAKKADDVASLLLGVLADLKHELKLSRWQTNDSISPWLTAVAKSDDDSIFAATDVAVLKAAAEQLKATVRVKDKEIDSHEVQELLKDGQYLVSELGMAVLETGDDNGIEGLCFTLTSKGVFKALKFPDLTLKSAIADINGEEVAAEFHAIAHLVSLGYTRLLGEVTATLGGEVDPFEDDDDEL